MFQKYQLYYRLFRINKLSSRTFSSWRNSTTTFVGQLFQQIRLTKNDWQLHCIISFNHQQFCQHSQFCSGNDDLVLSFSVKKRNSSNILSPEMSINNTIQQKEQYSDETEKQNVENEQTLETQMIRLDYFNKKQLKLKLEMGKSGQKFFQIALKNPTGAGQYSYFPNILVPEDAYAFVRALDELIVELAAENFEQKMRMIKDHQSTIANKNGVDGSHLKNKGLKLHNVELICQKHKFQLELLFFPNEHQANGQKSICLRFISFSKTNQKRTMTLPIHALPWLRKQMAKMLIKYDGTEAITLKAPAQIPKQFLLRDDNVTHTPLPLASNGISLGQKMQQNGNRQPSINKNSKFVQQYSKMPTKMQNSNQNSAKKKKHNMATVFAAQQKDVFRAYLANGHQKRVNPATQNVISFGGKLKKANGPKNEYQFNKRSIKEIDGSLANMEKVLMELSKENVGLKKEILGLKREIKDVFNAHPVSNCTSAGHKLEQKGIQPQFVNKKPTSFITEISKNMANMQKDLMEIREEKGELNKEIRHLKREINDAFHIPSVPNGIFSLQKLDQKGLQPQFINKKPTSFQQYPKKPVKLQNFNQNGVKNQKMFMPSNLKQSEVKKPNKNGTKYFDPKTAEFEEDIEIDTLFDFDDEEM